jgi:hypothetical protein
VLPQRLERVEARSVEHPADLLEREPEVTVEADLLEALEVGPGVAPVAGRGPLGGLQQPISS